MIYDVALILAHALNKDKSLDDETKARTDLGIKCFGEGRTKYLLIYGRHSNLEGCHGISLARAMKNYAVTNGVPSKKILEEDLTLETIGQLIFSKIGIIDPKNWKKILIISHDYHIPRVRIISDVVFGNEYNVEFEGVGLKSNMEIGLLEKETASTNMFRETFKGVPAGDDKELLERLFKSHERYRNNSEYFKKKLKRINLLSD